MEWRKSLTYQKISGTFGCNLPTLLGTFCWKSCRLKRPACFNGVEQAKMCLDLESLSSQAIEYLSKMDVFFATLQTTNPCGPNAASQEHFWGAIRKAGAGWVKRRGLGIWLTNMGHELIGVFYGIHFWTFLNPDINVGSPPLAKVTLWEDASALSTPGVSSLWTEGWL